MKTQAEDPPDPPQPACNSVAPVCAGVTLLAVALDHTTRPRPATEDSAPEATRANAAAVGSLI